MLELSRAGRIQPEIRLQRDLHPDTGRHIDEGTAGPDRSVQRGELVVRGRYQLHEMIADHVRVGAVQRTLQVGVNDALLSDFLLDIVIDQLGVVLRTDAGERFALCLRDTQLLKSVLDVFGDIFPVGLHAGVVAHIGDDIVHIQTVDLRPPVRHVGAVIDLEGFQAEFPHPVRVVFLPGNGFHDLRRQAFVHLVGVSVLIAEIIERAMSSTICLSFST